jgi:hypothetical protein
MAFSSHQSFYLGLCHRIYDRVGLPIIVGPTAYPSRQLPIGSGFQQIWGNYPQLNYSFTPQGQANWLRDLILMCRFSPFIKGITYCEPMQMDIYPDEHWSWAEHALFDGDRFTSCKPKPALYATKWGSIEPLQTWNLINDKSYSGLQGTNGWYFEEFDGNSYIPLSWNDMSNFWQGSVEFLRYYPDHDLVQSWDNIVVIKWIAPLDGFVHISSCDRVRKNASYPGTNTTVQIYLNTIKKYEQQINGNNVKGFYLDTGFWVEQGDVIYFHNNPNDWNTASTIKLNPIIRLFAPDLDNDSLLDSEETMADTDSDGMPNYVDLDSDGDTYPDQDEVLANSDPYDADDVPHPVIQVTDANYN